MKRLVSFLGYVLLILVGLLGAYIVFHMWQISERFRHKDSPNTRQIERTAAGDAQSVASVNSEDAKTKISPRPAQNDAGTPPHLACDGAIARVQRCASRGPIRPFLEVNSLNYL
jgi:hypothetical protein